MTKESKSINPVETKKRGRKKTESIVKGIGLFDHIKHIKNIQNPNYFKNLTDLDKKSFNPFMILKGMSMNLSNIEEVSILYRYFNIIPHPQFYQLLIGLFPIDRKYYPWIKDKKSLFSNQLLEFVAKFYEISKKEAEEYAILLSKTEKGKKELEDLCRGYGLSDKEIELIMKGNNENE